MDDRVVDRQLAIISSMTKKERSKPALMNASRKKRVAAGSGTQVQDVNRLLKMHRQMSDMMKKLGRKKGGLAGLFGGGMPQMPDEAAMDAHAPGWNRGQFGKFAGWWAAGASYLVWVGGLPGLPGTGKSRKLKK